MTRLARVLCLLLVATLLALPGCNSGPRTFPVHGKVTYKGKPVPNGTVLFTPLTVGPTATGEIGKDGSYSLTTYKPGDGAVVGKYKVTIVAMEDMTGRLPEDRNPLPPPIIPDKYSTLGTTDLTGEVNEGENTINFDLPDPKKK